MIDRQLAALMTEGRHTRATQREAKVVELHVTARPGTPEERQLLHELRDSLGPGLPVMELSDFRQGVLKSARIKVIWFPKNYFTPRERPLDYRRFLALVGESVD